MAWLGASVLGVVNGTIREAVFRDRVGEKTANQVSVGTLVALLGLYFWVLQRRLPIATGRDALEIGGAWVALTILFESGFGHYVAGDSWSELLENYDITEGQLWVVVLLWIGAGPATARAAARALRS